MQIFGDRLQFLRDLFSRGGEERREVAQILTPEVVTHRGPLTKLLVGGATMIGLAAAGIVAVGSLVSLMLAVGAIYFLLTQVLGLRLDLDPRVFVERAQAYARSQAN